jgi:hypothetical protein
MAREINRKMEEVTNPESPALLAEGESIIPIEKVKFFNKLFKK